MSEAAHPHPSAAHQPHSRKEYFAVFGALCVLTALEIGVYYTHISQGLMISALILLALAKAGAVALFFMHLKLETRVLRIVVFSPPALVAIYALVLILENSWRFMTSL